MTCAVQLPLTNGQAASRDRYVQTLLRTVRPQLIDLADKGPDSRVYGQRQLAYMHSQAAKEFALFRARWNTTISEVVAAAELLNPVSNNSGEVTWRRCRRPGGRKRRKVCVLPLALKARHYLIKDLLFAANPAPDHIYDAPKKGRDAAVQAVKHALEEGRDYCWVGDIRDCFQLVSPSALAHSLPLPRSVIRSNLDHRDLNISPLPMGVIAPIANHVADGLRRHGPRGLLAGSPASNAVLSVLLADAAEAVAPHDCTLCVYADNFFLAARSELHREEGVAALTSYLATHPCGPFRLHKENRARPGETFEFLGYEIIPTAQEIVVQPTYRAFERMYGAFADGEELDLDRGDGLITETAGKVRQYLSAYPLWADGPRELECVLWQTESLAAGKAQIGPIS